MRKLPYEYDKIYKDFYTNYSEASNFFRKLSLLVEKWYHLQAYQAYPNAESILEIGAGNLNHLDYEKSFKIYDVVEPKNYLLKIAPKSTKKLIDQIYTHIDEVPNKKVYDKIIAIAVLEHIKNLDLFCEQLSKHLKEEGKLVIEIPAEGEFLWWLGWRLTTGIGFWLKYKLDYGIIMRYEHINNAQQVINSIKRHFIIEDIKSFPFNIKNFRLYIHIICKKK